MGFQQWFDGFKLVLLFVFMIGIPCSLIAVFGSKMVNELGNFPSKAPEIQLKSSWIIIVELIFAAIIVGVLRLLNQM